MIWCLSLIQSANFSRSIKQANEIQMKLHYELRAAAAVKKQNNKNENEKKFKREKQNTLTEIKKTFLIH